jgi:hypothetical protein
MGKSSKDKAPRGCDPLTAPENASGQGRVNKVRMRQGTADLRIQRLGGYLIRGGRVAAQVRLQISCGLESRLAP